MSTTTQALVLAAAGQPLEWDDVTLGTLHSDELLVDIHATGICHTDIACMTGRLPVPMPQVLGHEGNYYVTQRGTNRVDTFAGAGVVVAVGSDVLTLSPGDQVVLSYNHCGSCQQCTDGHPAYCESLWSLNFEGERLDGSAPLASRDCKIPMGNFFGQSSFSRRAIVNKRCAVKVDRSVDLTKFAPLGCGLQTGAGVVLNTLNIQEGASLAVFGAGAVGMSAIMAAKIRGASLIVAVDLQEHRRDLAIELGAHISVDGSHPNIVEQIRSLVPPRGLMNAIDTTSNPRVIEKMIECLGTRGKAVSIGSPPPGAKVEIDVFSHLNLGREYLGSTQGDSIAQQVSQSPLQKETFHADWPFVDDPLSY